MIEYGTIALRQFPRYEKFVLAAMIRQQMYEVLKMIVETNKRTYRKTALTELDIAHETLRHLVDLSYRRLKYLDHKKYILWMEKIKESPKASWPGRYSREDKIGIEIGNLRKFSSGVGLREL